MSLKKRDSASSDSSGSSLYELISSKETIDEHPETEPVCEHMDIARMISCEEYPRRPEPEYGVETSFCAGMREERLMLYEESKDAPKPDLEYVMDSSCYKAADPVRLVDSCAGIREDRMMIYENREDSPELMHLLKEEDRESLISAVDILEVCPPLHYVDEPTRMSTYDEIDGSRNLSYPFIILDQNEGYCDLGDRVEIYEGPRAELVIEPKIEIELVEGYADEVDNTPQEDNKFFMFKECCSVKTMDDKRCGCGRLITDHPDEITEDAEKGEWIPILDTRKMQSFPRELYFRLNETSGNRAKAARYVRLADDTNIELVAEYHGKSWLPHYKPDVLVSFLGGCGRDFISRNSENTLTEGLSKILRNCDSLFFTRASHTGLAKLVGSICNSYTQRWNSGYVNQCVGFMPWGCVAGRESLKFDEADEIVEYELENPNDTTLSLDHNHEVFFLVDDGSIDRFGTEVSLRSGLQQFLSHQHKIPSVNLLLGGGLTSIAELHSAVLPEKEVSNSVLIPMVILKNSGRAADVISYVLESDLNNDKWIHRKYMKYRNINLMLAAKRAAFKYLKVDLTSISNLRSLALVCECVEKQRDKIFICDVDKKNNDLHELIWMAGLQVAFFNEKTSSFGNAPPYRELKIAMELKRVKCARELMRKMKKAAYYPMDDSLLRCNPRVVQELLEIYDFNVKSYTEDTLQYLYTSQEYKDTRGIRYVIDYFTKKYPFKPVDKDHVTVEDEEKTEPFISFDINKTLDRLTDQTVNDLHHMPKNKISYRKEIINSTQALMINCILVNQPNLAKVFWKFDKYNPLSNALLAFKLHSSIAKLYKSSAPQQLKDTIEYYKDKITQLLSTYYETDQAMTEKVLARKIPMWGDRSLVDVAGDFKSRFFIQHPASQLVVKQAWIGQDPDQKAYLENLKKRSEEECCLPGQFFGLCHLVNRTVGTPRSKLFAHVVMYLFSMAIFSFYLVVKDSAIHEPIKWVMFVMMCSLALEEIRQVTDFRKKKFGLNLQLWIADPWNILDMVSIVLFFTGFTASIHHKLSAKLIYSVFLCLWCIKFTQFLRISRRIGPYMVMIFQMLEHMKTFLLVLFISVLGYGTFMAALLFPDAKASWTTLFMVIFRPYLLVFGDTGLESRELSTSKTVFGTKSISRVSEIMVIVGMALFMLFANVLLLNLLIAAFSNIYERVKAISYEIWRFEQFELLMEFKRRPMLPFPFSIPENLCLIMRYFRGTGKQQIVDTQEKLRSDREIADFERFCMMKLWPKICVDEEEESKCEQDQVLTALGELTMDMTDGDDGNMKAIRNQKEQLRKRVEAVKDVVLDRLEKTEDRLDQRLNAIEEMIMKLANNFQQTSRMVDGDML